VSVGGHDPNSESAKGAKKRQGKKEKEELIQLPLSSLGASLRPWRFALRFDQFHALQ